MKVSADCHITLHTVSLFFDPFLPFFAFPLRLGAFAVRFERWT